VPEVVAKLLMGHSLGGMATVYTVVDDAELMKFGQMIEDRILTLAGCPGIAPCAPN
jgi:hypothetical protein